MPTLSAEALLAFSRALLEAGGVPADEAGVVAQSLVDANLCGHDSHGVIRVPQYLEAVADGRYRAGAPFEVLTETPAMLTADELWIPTRTPCCSISERACAIRSGVKVPG